MLIAVVFLLIVPNTLCFLLFIGDMRRRGENHLSWWPRFLLLGPFAVAWYRSVRGLVENETRPGDTLYNLSLHFILPWSIYALVVPIFVWATMIALDLSAGVASMSTGQFILSGLAWLPVFYVISMVAAVPVWLVLTIACVILMVVRRPRSDV